MIFCLRKLKIFFLCNAKNLKKIIAEYHYFVYGIFLNCVITSQKCSCIYSLIFLFNIAEHIWKSLWLQLIGVYVVPSLYNWVSYFPKYYQFLQFRGIIMQFITVSFFLKMDPVTFTVHALIAFIKIKKFKCIIAYCWFYLMCL